MVKFVQCVTRKPGMDAIEFRNRWTEYGKRLEELVRDRKNVVRYRLSTTLLVRATISFMMEYGSAPPFDGMVEIWLEDATITAANLSDNQDARRQVRELTDMLGTFVDREKTMAFYAAEEMGFDQTPERRSASVA
jgi:hypothetical protein